MTVLKIQRVRVKQCGVAHPRSPPSSAVESGAESDPGSQARGVLTAWPQPAGLENESAGGGRATGTAGRRKSIARSPAVGLALHIYNACFCSTLNVQVTALLAMKHQVQCHASRPAFHTFRFVSVPCEKLHFKEGIAWLLEILNYWLLPDQKDVVILWTEIFWLLFWSSNSFPSITDFKIIEDKGWVEHFVQISISFMWLCMWQE